MKPARFEQEKGFEHKWSTLKCHCKSNSRSSVFLKLADRLGKAHSTGGERRPSGESCHKFPSPPPSDCPLTFIRVTVQKKVELVVLTPTQRRRPIFRCKDTKRRRRIWHCMFYIAYLSWELPSGNPQRCGLPPLPGAGQSARSSEERWLVSWSRVLPGCASAKTTVLHANAVPELDVFCAHFSQQRIDFFLKAF